MEKMKFYKEIVKIFSSFGVDDLRIVEKSDKAFLMLKIDAEDGMKEYNIIMEFIDEEYLALYAVFKHQAMTRDERLNLLKLVNKCNKETFLKFQIDNKYLIINYFIPEIEEKDEKRIVKIVSLFPSLIAEFYPDFKKYLE